MTTTERSNTSARRERLLGDEQGAFAVARYQLMYAPERDDAVLARTQAGGVRVLEAMDDHLAERTFLVGERFTVADIALYAYTHVAHEGGFDLDRYPAVQAWLARVAAQPGHVGLFD